MAFINVCDRLRTLPMILPPHSTQRLQPPDASLSLPLATYYTNGLNDLIFKSLGLVSVSKRSFRTVFWPAWNQAFSAQNIASAFKKTGVWPYNPAIIPNTITIPPVEDTATTVQAVKTPTTCRAVRRFQKAYKKDSNPDLLTKLFRANLHLASQHSIDRHVASGLVEALGDELK